MIKGQTGSLSTEQQRAAMQCFLVVKFMSCGWVWTLNGELLHNRKI